MAKADQHGRHKNMTSKTATLPRQIVANTGLYFVCYRLSQLGWNVMPTARNARGIDAIAYSHDGKKTTTIQVKSLSKKRAVPLGTHLDNLIAEHVVVCCGIGRDTTPECFVMPTRTVKRMAARDSGGKRAFWLESSTFSKRAYREAWEKQIGPGV